MAFLTCDRNASGSASVWLRSSLIALSHSIPSATILCLQRALCAATPMYLLRLEFGVATQCLGEPELTVRLFVSAQLAVSLAQEVVRRNIVGIDFQPALEETGSRLRIAFF